MNEQLPFISETSTLPLLSSMCRVRRGENFRVHGKTVSRPMLCLVLQGEGVLILMIKYIKPAPINYLYWKRGPRLRRPPAPVLRNVFSYR